MSHNINRKIGNIPEDKLLELYAGPHSKMMTQKWVPVISPRTGSFNQIRLEYSNHDLLIQIAYSKTGNCIMVVKKDRACYEEIWQTLSRTLIPIEEPHGPAKVQKMIGEFVERVNEDS